MFSIKTTPSETHADHQPQVRPEAFCRGITGSEGDVHRVFGTVSARVAHEAFVAKSGKDSLAPHGITGTEVLL
jgi:hypothetical protein